MALALLCLIGVVGTVVLVAVVRSRTGEKSRTADETDLAAIVDVIEGLEPSEGAGKASAVTWARQMAVEISQIDDSVLDRQIEVLYGLRTFNAESAEYEIRWGGTPTNVVKVVARDDDAVASESDTAVPVVFTGVFGSDGSLLRAEAIVYMDAPDLVDAVD